MSLINILWTFGQNIVSLRGKNIVFQTLLESLQGFLIQDLKRLEQSANTTHQPGPSIIRRDTRQTIVLSNHGQSYIMKQDSAQLIYVQTSWMRTYDKIPWTRAMEMFKEVKPCAQASQETSCDFMCWLIWTTIIWSSISVGQAWWKLISQAQWHTWPCPLSSVFALPAIVQPDKTSVFIWSSSEIQYSRAQQDTLATFKYV